MNTSSIRSKLDILIESTISYNKSSIPVDLFKNINKWKWGQYGWISPVSLIVTAAWVKAYFPEQDCCKIWARDEQDKPIKGSYSIRSEDESITIPLFSKYNLCKGFCSDNSGMQGSRAIEKMRSLKRLDINFNISQRTIFDLKLFAIILNQLNNLTSSQSFELLKLMIVKAKEINSSNISVNNELNKIKNKKNPFEILKNNPDPELVKCIAASCYRFIFDDQKYSIQGISDHKTSADARSMKSGDICFVNNSNSEILALEVKANSIKIDWQNIGRAEKIITSNSKIRGLIFVHENSKFMTDPSMIEILKSERLTLYPGSLISFISLRDLYIFSLMFATELELTKKIAEYITQAPSIKPKTKSLYLDAE